MELRRINDYYEQMYEKFPDIDKNEIKKILNFGWKNVYLMNSFGGDVLIKSSSIICYFGMLFRNSVVFFHYYRRKLINKIRMMYKRKHIPYDGYYYFAMTKKQYEDYINQQKKRGRPRKYFKLNNVLLYKIKDVCELENFTKKYIFRISMPIEGSNTIFRFNFKFENPELIKVRERPLNFQDILVTNNNYICYD